jgi:hypothetical protein
MTVEQLAVRWRINLDDHGNYKRLVRQRAQRLRLRKLAGMGKTVLYRPVDVLSAEEMASKGGAL